MSKIEILLLSNVLAIWFLSLRLLYIVGKAKHGLVWSVWRSIIAKDKEGIQWMNANRYLYVFYILIPGLIFLSLGLLSQLESGLPYIRKENTMSVSVFIWMFVALAFTLSDKKIRNNEK